MDKITFTKTATPAWLLAMWKEIDDKAFGRGFDCFAEDVVCNLGVADWHGREAIRTCGLHLRRVALYPAELRARFTSLNPIDLRRSTDSNTFNGASRSKRPAHRAGTRYTTRLFAVLLRKLLTRRIFQIGQLAERTSTY